MASAPLTEETTSVGLSDMPHQGCDRGRTSVSPSVELSKLSVRDERTDPPGGDGDR